MCVFRFDKAFFNIAPIENNFLKFAFATAITHRTIKRMIGKQEFAHRSLCFFDFLASVSSDSRCPSDVDCITAGDAAVELWLRRPPSARETRSVHSDASQGASAEYDGFEVELLSLEPLPRSDAPVAADAYRARLVVR
jgi:hypothetical protein